MGVNWIVTGEIETRTFALPSEKKLIELYSFPNLLPRQTGTEPDIAATISHYLQHTLRRDGLSDGVHFRVEMAATEEHKTPSVNWAIPMRLGEERRRALKQQVDTLCRHLSLMLGQASSALVEMKKIKERIERKPGEKVWDPERKARGKDDEGRDWRPFFGHGLPLVNHRCVQFFHYPPLRLLTHYRDYLDDPVPRKVEQLLLLNMDVLGLGDGWKLLCEHGEAAPDKRQQACEVVLYERVVDGCPIAASDDQGSKPVPGSTEKGLMPMEDFLAYQGDQLRLLLRAHPDAPGYTIPLVVYGDPAREQLAKLAAEQAEKSPGAAFDETRFEKSFTATRVTLKTGLTTPALLSVHPYALFMKVQGGPSGIGKGKFVFPAKSDHAAFAKQVESALCKDLAVARWSLRMWQDPILDPQTILNESLKHWQLGGGERHQQVRAMIRHLSSYKTKDEDELEYEFLESIERARQYVDGHRDAPYGE